MAGPSPGPCPVLELDFRCRAEVRSVSTSVDPGYMTSSTCGTISHTGFYGIALAACALDLHAKVAKAPGSRKTMLRRFGLVSGSLTWRKQAGLRRASPEMNTFCSWPFSPFQHIKNPSKPYKSHRNPLKTPNPKPHKFPKP